MSARFLFTLAVQMQAVVLGWRIYEILNDPLALGFIGLSEAVPAIGLALYAGYVVDRMRPLLAYRRIMFISLLSGVLVLAEHLLAQQIPVVAQAGLLYAAAFLTGTARSFSGPAIFASVPRMVPREDLFRAMASMSTAMQVARVAGPALGGLVFGYFGAITSSSMVCLFLIGAITAMAQIRVEVPAPEKQFKHTSITDELLSGARFVFKHKILLPALSLDMISVLFGGVTALLPIFAKEVLFIGPKGLGALRAAPAVGAALMGFYLSRNPEKFRTGKTLFKVVMGFGLCILVFGLSQNYLISLAALVASGMFDSVSMVIRSAAVQLTSPDHMRGKIAAVNSIFIGSSNEIGEFESGVAAKIFGPVPSVYIGGCICLLTVAMVATISPELRRLDLVRLKNEA
ncbi:MAG: MFS transporter [Pseudobdellovibrio sp.]